MVGAPVRAMPLELLLRGWPPDVPNKLNRPRRSTPRREKSIKRWIDREWKKQRDAATRET